MFPKNINLIKAKKNKNDEFYTQYSDIKNELDHYKEQFENKIIYCNCDNPKNSQFWKYFKDNFKKFKLKKIISLYYIKNDWSYKTEYNGIKEIITPLFTSGDFRDKESIDILKETDIVITNPPFSLFTEYIQQLFTYNKKFIIIGTITSITKDFLFNRLKNKELSLGYGFKNGNAFFKTIHPVSDYAKNVYNEKTDLIKFRNIIWYTNLRFIDQEKLVLKKIFNKENYKYYDNTDIININKIIDIPKDYKGLMGVPITFLYKYNSNQFNLIMVMKKPIIDNKCKYIRIIIQKK